MLQTEDHTSEASQSCLHTNTLLDGQIKYDLAQNHSPQKHQPSPEKKNVFVWNHLEPFNRDTAVTFVDI